jgi:hypothetical protein
MIDLDKMNLTMIPLQHTMVEQSLVINENKALKRTILIGIGVGIFIIIINKISNDKREKN